MIACTSPSEALGMLRAGFFDAIVTDHRLGGEPGSEFIAQARHRGVACPILMVTAGHGPHLERAAYAAGATKIFMGGRGDFPEYLRHLLGCSMEENASEKAAGR